MPARRHDAVTARPWKTALLLALVLMGTGAALPALSKGKTHTVAIDAVTFSPQDLEVEVGDTITWTNQDPFPHTVTATGRGFDSALILPGRSWKLVVQTPGAFSYFCTLHQTMKGTIVVK